jgi:hypothetical protein
LFGWFQIQVPVVSRLRVAHHEQYATLAVNYLPRKPTNFP